MSLLPGSPRTTTRLAAVCIMVALALSCHVEGTAHGATATEFAAANQAIQAAFLSTRAAEASGGNVSSLVAQLNSAVETVQVAETQNSTNPAEASAELANASSIAHDVTVEAPIIGQQGAIAKHDQEMVSLGAAAVVVMTAVAIYSFGDRLYRRAWLRLYRGHVVRKTG